MEIPLEFRLETFNSVVGHWFKTRPERDKKHFQTLKLHRAVKSATIDFFYKGHRVTSRTCLHVLIAHLRDFSTETRIILFWLKLLQKSFDEFEVLYPGVQGWLKDQPKNFLKCIKNRIVDSDFGEALFCALRLREIDETERSLKSFFDRTVGIEHAVSIFEKTFPDVPERDSRHFMPNPEEYVPSSPIRNPLEPLFGIFK